MEKYLEEEYDVHEDKVWLTDESQIEDYFKDDPREFFDCGQGYYQDVASLICKIDDKFYEVQMDAEIGSAKQDIGDRLYWVERIDSVVYKEIEKPQPSSRIDVKYELNITEQQRKSLENFMNESNIEF